MSKIEKELVDATEVSAKRGEKRQEFLTRLVKAANDLPDAKFNALSEKADAWINSAFDAMEAKPPKDMKDIMDVFKSILHQEVEVTGEINAIVDLCLKEKDYTTHNFMQWYVAEQIEEERLARTMLDKLNLIGSDKGGLYLFDRDLMASGNTTA